MIRISAVASAITQNSTLGRGEAKIKTTGGLDIQLFDQNSPNAAELLRKLHDDVPSPSFRPEEYVSPAAIEPDSKLAVVAATGDGLVVGGAAGEVGPASGFLLLG